MLNIGIIKHVPYRSMLYASILLAGRAQAAELQPPIFLYTVGLPSPSTYQPEGAQTNCPALGSAGPIDPGRLVIRDSVRPDVGPYSVKLPGYTADPNSAAADSYRPFLTLALPGDTLRFDMVNQLATTEPLNGVVNLHTHGLIVSPRPCTPLGDYLFVHDQPSFTTSYRMDIPTTVPGYMFGAQPTPRAYPSGLNWFHAHVHEKARIDVMAGQSGMLYIGDLRADLLAAPNLPAASASTLNRSDIVYLGLRDIQLSVPKGAEPDKVSSATTGQFLSGDNYNSGLCPGQANPPQPPSPGQLSGFGYCGQAGQTPSSPDTVWLFTVNGQYDATDTMQAGRHQIWRIANLSSNVAYVLELVDDASGQLQTLDVLSLDGLIAGTSAPGGADLNVGVKLKHILLMPASRAEVFVPNVAGYETRRMTLRTAGITTGPVGDPWPRINLAHVVMTPVSLSPTPQTATDATLTATDPSQIPLSVVLPNAAPTSATPMAVPTANTAGVVAAPSQCVTLPAGMAVRRRISFMENVNYPQGQPPFAFGFESEVVTPAGQPIDSAHTIGPEAFPMQAMLAPNSVKRVCPQLGTQEVWELVNTTFELHNFHLHQSKFRLSVQSDAGAPPGMVAVQDPSGIIKSYEPEVQGATPTANVDVWHDVLPVPPAFQDPSTGKITYGRTFVTIPFYAKQQVGDFVFHCHILEHEDGGMMAVVQVYDPTQLASADPESQFASLIQSSICKFPPTAP